MEETVLKSAAQFGIVGLGFIYLLIFQTKTIMKALESISTNMKEFASSLKEVSDSLIKLDTRVQALERNMDEVVKEVK